MSARTDISLNALLAAQSLTVKIQSMILIYAISADRDGKTLMKNKNMI